MGDVEYLPVGNGTFTLPRREYGFQCAHQFLAGIFRERFPVALPTVTNRRSSTCRISSGEEHARSDLSPMISPFLGYKTKHRGGVLRVASSDRIRRQTWDFRIRRPNPRPFHGRTRISGGLHHSRHRDARPGPHCQQERPISRTEHAARYFLEFLKATEQSLCVLSQTRPSEKNILHTFEVRVNPGGTFTAGVVSSQAPFSPRIRIVSHASLGRALFEVVGEFGTGSALLTRPSISRLIRMIYMGPFPDGRVPHTLHQFGHSLPGEIEEFQREFQRDVEASSHGTSRPRRHSQPPPLSGPAVARILSS